MAVRLALAALVLATAVTGPALAASLTREAQKLTVAGTTETWALVWGATPKPACGPEDVETASTCPCAGIAYGEQGPLSLERRRGTTLLEKLDLGPLFAGFDPPDPHSTPGTGWLPRWPLHDSDLERADNGDAGLGAEIRHRPVRRLMNFADYDRDGHATEFLLQVGTLPCAKLQFAAVGLGGASGKLHALTSAAHPERPLILPLDAWRALAKGPGPSRIDTLACGDHASETREEVIVTAAAGRITAKTRSFSCPAPGQPETPLGEDGL